MAAAKGAFGKRSSQEWTAANAGAHSAADPIDFGRKTTRAASRSNGSEPVLKLERTWLDAAQGAFFIFLGTYLYGSMGDNPFLWLIVIGLISSGALILANHFIGTAKLVVDDEGFRNEGLLLSKEMRWQDIHSFQITTINWTTVINAKSLKAEGSKSNVYVHIPNAAFKMKSLEFVKALLAQRPDMATATFEVMDHLGVARLIKNENRKAR